MDTTLLVQLSGNTWERVDLFQDVPITLTIQQNDLANLTSRRVPYSKTIQLPDTANNADLFEHYFEINGVEFNPLQKINCVVQYRGTDIFQGVLRMNSVTTTALERTYEIFILGEVADFTAQFRNLQLQDLDWVDLNHELVYSSVTKSWECVNDGASGLLDGKIIYPLINYGLDYQGDSSSGATPTFSYDFDTPTSFDDPARPVPASMFKPAIQVKDVVDRIFAKTDYQLNSQFFDSEYFTSIYMDTFQNANTGIEYASGVTNQNIFLANGLQQSIKYDQGQRHVFGVNTTVRNGYDPLGNFFNNGGTNNGPYFRAPYNGKYGWNIQFVVSAGFGLTNPVFPPKIVIEAYKTTNLNTLGTLFYSSPEINLSQAFFNTLDVNLFFDEVLNAGEIIQIRIFDKTISPTPLPMFPPQRNYQILPFFNDTVQKSTYLWELYESPTLIEETVDMSLGIPNIECVEFLRGLITLFNLIVIQDEQSKSITIEPYNWYYNDPDRLVRDWTNILDTNSPVKVEPLSFDLAKDNTWTYKFTDQEYLPKLFSDRFDFVFGRQKIGSLSNILTGENVYELPFGSCPTSGVTNAPNFIIPQFFYQNNQQQTPYATIPHLFFWVGNRLAYKDSFKTVQGSWYLLSGSTPVEWTTYPCVSHLSTLESQLSLVISDLNFQSTFDFFGNSNKQIQQFTEFNLYQSFWENYITNLYDPTNKRLSGQFYFRPIDVYETKENDKIWIKDAWFSIEKISDADLVNKRLTQISLIKDLVPYYKIEPPAPIYIYTPNQGYPVPEPFYYTLAYYSTNQTAVCDGTAAIRTVYGFGGPTIQNGDKLYIDTGTAYQYPPMGTFIRQTTSSTTFVVANNYGEVLEITC